MRGSSTVLVPGAASFMISTAVIRRPIAVGLKRTGILISPPIGMERFAGKEAGDVHSKSVAFGPAALKSMLSINNAELVLVFLMSTSPSVAAKLPTRTCPGNS